MPEDQPPVGGADHPEGGDGGGTATATPPATPDGGTPAQEPQGQPPTNYEQRMRDKDSHIGTLTSQASALRADNERLRSALGPAPGPGNGAPASAKRFEEQFEGMRPNELHGTIGEMIQDGVRKGLETAIPNMMRAQDDRAGTARGFEELRDAGIEDTPENLRLDQVLPNMTPVGAFVEQLRVQKGPKAAADFLAGQAERQRMAKLQAQVAESLTTGKGPGMDHLRNIGFAGGPHGPDADPDHVGYYDGEKPSFFFELGLAPDSRRVKNNEQWVSREGAGW